MTKDDFIQQAIKIICATDTGGYPLPAHTKIARLHILTDNYTKDNK